MTSDSRNQKKAVSRFTCPFPECTSSFTRHNNLNMHLMYKHSHQNPQELFPEIFSKQRARTREPQLDQITCPVIRCKETFDDRDAFLRHFNEFHKNSEEFDAVAAVAQSLPTAFNSTLMHGSFQSAPPMFEVQQRQNLQAHFDIAPKTFNPLISLPQSTPAPADLKDSHVDNKPKSRSATRSVNSNPHPDPARNINPAINGRRIAPAFLSSPNPPFQQYGMAHASYSHPLSAESVQSTHKQPPPPNLSTGTKSVASPNSAREALNERDTSIRSSSGSYSLSPMPIVASAPDVVPNLSASLSGSHSDSREYAFIGGLGVDSSSTSRSHPTSTSEEAKRRMSFTFLLQ